MHTAWPQSGPPASNLQGHGFEVHPSNPSWMSFDSSTQLSSMFGDLSSPVSAPPAGSSANNAFSAVPIQPTSVHLPPSNDPFAPVAAKFPDPFADLAVLPAQTASQPGKKVSKGDFIKEPPKPTLLDLSTQQLRQPQSAPDLTTAAADPFAAVSPPRNGSPFRSNPFQQENLNFHTPSFTPNPAQRTVDKSRAVYPPAPNVFSEAQNTPYLIPARPDFADHPSSQVSRPRPKSNAGPKAALVLPLAPKVKPSMLCTKPIKHLHDVKLLRNNNNNTSECKTSPDNLAANDVNQPNNPAPPLTYLQKRDSAETAAKSFDELWLLSAARKDRLNSSEESIWCWASINDESGKTQDLKKREQDKHLKYNAFDSSLEKQNSTTKDDSQNLDMGEIHVKSFQNCLTSTENLTSRCGPDASLTKKEKYLNVSDRDLSLLVPGRRNVGLGLSISEHGNVAQANVLQRSSLPKRNTEKLTLASLARRSSARKTCSLQGLVTIREENDFYSHPCLQPAMSADGNENKNLLQTPSFLTKHISKSEIGAENCTQNAAKDASSETCLKLNPFAGVDPFVTDAFALGDPFDNQNGRLVCKDACGFFDLLQVDSKPFCTKAVTVDFNTKRVC